MAHASQSEKGNVAPNASNEVERRLLCVTNQSFSKKQLADIMVEWCFALKDPIIGGAGSTDYVEVLTSLSSIVTGRLIADSLLDLGLGLPDVVDALTHRQTGVDAAKLVKFLRENDPTS